MAKTSTDNSVIIIGAGFAGLSAGIYSQMNGYKTQIFEMHSKPGGLCTSWKRNGYTIDGCIHWLVGSSPDNGMHDMWEEVGLIQNREIIDMEEFTRLEDLQGRKLIFYNNVDKLEKHLLEFSPQDAEPINDFIKGIRMCMPFDQPSEKMPALKRMATGMRLAASFIRNGKEMQRWMKITAAEFSKRFKDPLLREAFNEIWIPEFSMLFMLFTFSYLHKKNAGYPLGGSMPMSRALEKKYTDLGGVINFRKKVASIITENNKAVGIKLDDGSEYRCGRVVSAADGHTTIFKMLEGKYTDENIRTMYETWTPFTPLIFAGIGVSRTFPDEAMDVSGFTFELKTPMMIGESLRKRVSVHLYNHDRSMAPEGKTTIVMMLPTNYEYWKELQNDREAYDTKKEEIGKLLVEALEQRFPGITKQVEMTDVATPMTFQRYTGNWRGSFEGWIITPGNSNTLMKPLSQKLPGLDNMFLCGQWVEPGGGLPPAIMSGKRFVKTICKEDRKKFRIV